MAGKKKLQVQLAVTTEEEWESNVIAKDGLVLVDVYSDWFGECTAMQSPLKRYKLETAGDFLNLVSACSNTIKVLERFCGISEPTWMFLAGGQMVNLYIGCNCPKLLRLLRKEIEREKRVLAGKSKRKVLPFNRITPAEKARLERLDSLDREKRAEEDERIAAELNRIRTKAYRQIADALPSTTIVLFLPHTLEDGELPEVASVLRDAWAEMGFNVTRKEAIEIDEEMANEIFWERKLPQHNALVSSLQAGPSVVIMLKSSAGMEDDAGEGDPGAEGDAPRIEVADEEEDEVHETMVPGEIERVIAESIYGFYPGSGSQLSPMVSLPEAEDEVALEEEPTTEPQAEPKVEPEVQPEVQPEGEPEGEPGEAGSQIALEDGEEGVGEEGEEGEEGELDQAKEGDADVADVEAADAELPDTQVSPGEGKQAEAEKASMTHSYRSGSTLGSSSQRSRRSSLQGPAEKVTWTPKEMRPVLDSPAALLLRRYSEENVVLPGIWTPLTPLSKAAAARVLFRNFTLQFYEEETPPPPPPPTLVAMFDAAKRLEVFEAMKGYEGEILHSAFFTFDKKKITDNADAYEASPFKTTKDKFVVAVSKQRSAPILSLASVGPSYISPNMAIGKQDLETFFSADVEMARVPSKIEVVAAVEKAEEVQETHVEGPVPEGVDPEAAVPAAEEAAQEAGEVAQDAAATELAVEQAAEAAEAAEAAVEAAPEEAGEVSGAGDAA